MKRPKPRYWHKGDIVPYVCETEYQNNPEDSKHSDNFVLHMFKKGIPSGRTIFIGNGAVMKVNEKGVITDVRKYSSKPYMVTGFENDTVFYFYLTCDCQNLSVAAYEFASYINSHYSESEIMLIGFFEAGLTFYKATQFLNGALNLSIATVACPFKGTDMVVPDAVEVTQFFEKNLHKIQSELFFKYVFYEQLAPNSAFLRGLPEEEDVCMYFRHINVVSQGEFGRVWDSREAKKYEVIQRHVNFKGYNHLCNNGISPNGSQRIAYENEGRYLQAGASGMHNEALFQAFDSINNWLTPGYWERYAF